MPAGPSPKLIGRAAAVLLALVFAGVVWWSVRSNPAPPASTDTDFTDTPDITEVEVGESIVLTLVDREDPGRIAAVIEADRLDPMGGGRRLLTNPRAWIYLQGGRAARVTADRAHLMMPVNEMPESGSLEGSVLVRVFDSDGPADPPPADAPPHLTASFAEPVTFERRYMRMNSPGPFTVDSDRVRFSGEDLAVTLNEARQRLERLDVARGGRMEILLADPVTPDDDQTGDPATDPAEPAATDAPTEADPGAAPGQTTPPEPAGPKIDLYRTLLDDAVVATLGAARVESDTLELLTRLTDGALAEDAIARVAIARSHRPETAPDPGPTDLAGPPAPGQAALEPVPAPSGEAPAPPAGDDDRLVITWAGPMRVRPIDDDAPAELETDDAALVLRSHEGQAVRLADDGAGLRGEAGAVRYFATRAVLHLDPQPDAPVRFDMADTGQGRFERVRADLAQGVIDLPGPGSVRSDSRASIGWTDAARLTLALDEAGTVTDRLEWAEFAGAVEAAQDGGLILAEQLAAEFAPDDAGAAALRLAIITNGSIAAEAGDPSEPPASLAAEHIQIEFEGPSDRPDPVYAEAVGGVRGQGDGATLEADEAVATLARDDAGEITVRNADAFGAVRYRAADGARAEGEHLAVDAPAETILIAGPDALIAQDDSVVHGPAIDLNARSRRMTVEGAGRFEHTLRDADGLPAGRVIARWAETMRFDDALGRLVATGDVSVVSTPDASTRDTLSAQRVEVDITPLPTRDPVGGSERSPERDLLAARAYGDSTADRARPATAETRRYDPADPERVTGLLYLEGDQINADAVANTLRVPGAGVMLVMDRRAQPDRPDDPAGGPPDAPRDPLGGSVGPGLTRFTWLGSFELDRLSGVAVMRDRVLVRHKTINPDPRSAPGAAPTDQIAELATDTLTARFNESDDADSPFALRSADAHGSVVFRATGKELFADGARYEAAGDLLHALAAPGRMVELHEPGRAAPISARAILWDLARDRIEINRPSPVTLPN